VIDGGVVPSKGWQLIRCPPRKHEIGSGIPLLAPESSREERLVKEDLTNMKPEPTGEDQNPGRSPAERHDGCSRMTDIVNSGDECLSTKHEFLRFPFNLTQKRGAAIRCPETTLDIVQAGVEEPNVSVEPQPRRRIESGLPVNGAVRRGGIAIGWVGASFEGR
jgi:hypothetical protein